MGMYTGLRCKVKVKKEYIEDVGVLMYTHDWNNCKHDILKEYAKVSRANFIPFGALCYMPDEWEYETVEDGLTISNATDGFDTKLDKRTGEWSFQCSLKNYDSTIEKFIITLSLIVDEIYHLEKLYEEDEESILYELKDGKITKMQNGIRYGNIK